MTLPPAARRFGLHVPPWPRPARPGEDQRQGRRRPRGHRARERDPAGPAESESRAGWLRRGPSGIPPPPVSFVWRITIRDTNKSDE